MSTFTNIGYGSQIKLNIPYEEAIEKVTAALKDEGFGVLTEVDVKATLKKKLDVDFQKYVILGACNPELAYRALQAEIGIGLLLPCNVIVYEIDDEKGDGQDGSSVVAIVDPITMLNVADNPSLGAIAEDVRERLQRVSQTLGA